MQVPLEINFRNLEPSDNLERRVRERVAKLEQFHRHLVRCHVTVEVPHRSQHNPLAYRVRIEAHVPDKQIVVSQEPGARDAHFDPYVAIRDAFDAMQRRLEDHAQKQRRAVKTHAAPLQGRILRMFPDHGFIATTDGQEIYFHRNSVVEADFDSLAEAEPVELVLIHGESPAGPQATTVKPIRPMQLAREPRP